jgi:GntR family transcriptional regulator
MSSVILPHTAIPKYYQLANILRDKIEAGEWPPRSPIPSERQLEQMYYVSRPTIRQAIEYLIQEGLLYREHGRGTFVSPAKLQKGLRELTSFTEDLVSRGITPGQVIRSIEQVVPPESVAQRLELPADRPVTRIERVRLGDGIPIGLQTSYIALDAGQEITLEDMERVGSLYRVLEEKLNIIPTEADETLEVTVATRAEAAQLQIKEGSPLLLSERLTFSQDRRPVEFVKILYRGDRYRYYTRLKR